MVLSGQRAMMAGLAVAAAGGLLLGYGLGRLGPWSAGGGAGDAVRFLSPEITLWEGEAQMVPFVMARAPFAPAEIPVSSSDAKVVEVREGGRVLARETTGFVRVRAGEPGTARLSLAGATAKVEVKAKPVLPAPRAPVVAGPVRGAAVWGTVAVAVDTAAADPPSLVALPGNRRWSPAGEPVMMGERGCRWRFDVDAGTLPAGPVELVAEAGELRSAAHPILVVHPDPAHVRQGESEHHLACLVEKRFKGRAPKANKDADASSEQATMLPSENPGWSLPLPAAAGGMYQVILRVRGNLAGGALPSCGVFLDEADRAAATTATLFPAWHRIPVGRPVRLEAGDRILTVAFMNDFYGEGRQKIDRNMALDTYEVLRLDDALAADEVAAWCGRGSMQISWTRPWDGQTVAGPVTLEADLVFDREAAGGVPVAILEVNGREVARQQDADPRFRLWPGVFQPGRNEIRLRAVSRHGEIAEAAPQSLRLPAAFGANTAAHRFGVEDDRWDAAFRQLVPAKGARRALLATATSGVLRLPDGLEGEFVVRFDGKGDQYKGPPKVLAEIEQKGVWNKVGEVEIPGETSGKHLGRVTLAPGPKNLRISFTNDLWEENKGDRNLHVRAIELEPAGEALDAASPEVAVVYPPARHRVFKADVVVADVRDDAGVTEARLVLDGQPLDWTARPAGGRGPVVLPLPARSLEPGTHRLSVRVRDRGGRTAESPARSIKVLARAPAAPGPYARATHLLNRLGFGQDDLELAAILRDGETAWLRERLSRPPDAPSEQAARQAAAAKFPDDRKGNHVAGRVIHAALVSDNPARQRFVLWVHNHFSTWLRKTGAPAKWDEHERFAALGAAPFGDLLQASASSPAMLVYLDQHRSFAGRLNENFARELLELHTVGVHAGYTQRDVTSLARVLTGWMATKQAPADGRPGLADEPVFAFEPALHDPSSAQVFGLHLDEADSPDAMRDQVARVFEMLAAHPATARFICRKLAEHYAAVPAPDALVDDLAAVFLARGGDLREVMVALSQHPEFWKTRASPRLSTPLVFAIGLGRTGGDSDANRVLDFLSKCGTGMFDRPSPDGFPEEPAAYADSNAMLQRWRLGQSLENRLFRLLPDPWRSLDQESPEAGDRAQELIDLLAWRITGQPLGERSNEAALQMARAEIKNPRDRVRGLLTFITQLPEAQLR